MKDLRTLCDEAIQLWDADCDMDGVVNEMRATLSQPEPEGPTDEQIADEARKYLVNEYALPDTHWLPHHALPVPQP
jgi:hypothetical protein